MDLGNRSLETRVFSLILILNEYPPLIIHVNIEDSSQFNSGRFKLCPGNPQVTSQGNHPVTHSQKENKGGKVESVLNILFSKLSVTAVWCPLSWPPDEGFGLFSPLLLAAGLSPSSSWSSLRLISASKLPSKSGNVGILGTPGHRDRRPESCLLSILQKGQKSCQLPGWNAAGFDWQIRQTQSTVKLASHDTDTQQPHGCERTRRLTVINTGKLGNSNEILRPSCP